MVIKVCFAAEQIIEFTIPRGWDKENGDNNKTKKQYINRTCHKEIDGKGKKAVSK